MGQQSSVFGEGAAEKGHNQQAIMKPAPSFILPTVPFKFQLTNNFPLIGGGEAPTHLGDAGDPPAAD